MPLLNTPKPLEPIWPRSTNPAAETNAPPVISRDSASKTLTLVTRLTQKHTPFSLAVFTWLDVEGACGVHYLYSRLFRLAIASVVMPVTPLDKAVHAAAT